MTTAQLIIQVLVMYGPEAAKAIQGILSKKDPTQADWDAIFLIATQKKYDDYISAAGGKGA